MPRGNFGDANKDPDKYIQDAKNKQATPAKGTAEQQAIWNVLLDKQDKRHVIVEAVAGSGKTFTIVEYAKQEKSHVKVGLVAFNVHIKDELRMRMGAYPNVECLTYHALGFRAIRNSMRGRDCDVEKTKVLRILDGFELIELPKQEDIDAYNQMVQAGVGGLQKPVSRRLVDAELKMTKYRIATMVSYAKSAGLDDDLTRDDLIALADRFDIDFTGVSESVVYDYVAPVLYKCKTELNTVDFDDQVWVPYVLKLPVPRYDVLCVDEYQDTGLTQQWLAIQSAKRLCAIGDPNQAIYAFRGADSRGFDRLRKRLDNQVVTLPLTFTRRCPTSHVALAQQVVPQIQALENAPEGLITYIPTIQKAVEAMKVGDLVMCRVNAELAGVAYKLLKRGVRAVIRGKNLGDGLLKLIKEAEQEHDSDEQMTVADVLKIAGEITTKQIEKFNAMPHDKGAMRAHNARDRYDCLCSLSVQAKYIRELKRTIEALFEDVVGQDSSVVTLGTVHRTKGLEANRVFILRPDLIPHPMSRKQEDQQGERNLGYVAVTRAKFDNRTGQPGELVFVGALPPLFKEKSSADDRDPEPDYEVDFESDPEAGPNLDQEITDMEEAFQREEQEPDEGDWAN